MKDLTNIKLIQKLKNMIPMHITPKFTNAEEWRIWQEEEGRKCSKAISRDNQAMKIQRIFKCSGIRPLHMNCSFDNYQVECRGQQIALERARQYAAEFNSNIASFIFSGKPGTGKNHLAVAISNDLILCNKSVLIITVADLMSSIKKTFNGNSNTTEDSLLNNFSAVDLLVIDEIGVQIESRYEKVIINQIVDRRSSSKRPTGMLSNLNVHNMNTLLGERVMDRMSLGNSLWVNFNWASYRSRVIGNEY
ncbi:DNA replication protein DnaC [Candidatus Profftia lariciata]|nr:DNA replication protein DnaC [Candidatus Profftia lariciata]UDG81608.1 DNA replication protein DnaC [Candidatus Profftia lariciata]